MKEVACQFGHRRQLVGVVTVPSTAPTGVGCLLVTAGLVPKFGPFRLYTQLARRLARDGVITLRFDLGGIGDSSQAYPGQLRERTQLEIRAAVDHLISAYSVDRAVLAGLCSGAEDSFRYAEHDSRIAGVVMIDPFAYRTPGWGWRYWLHRARRRLLRAVRAFRPSDLHSGEASAVTYSYMELAESTRILRTLLARRAGVHFVYTGGRMEVLDDPSQVKAMFPDLDFGGLVTVDYFPHTDHTQFLQEDRDAIIQAIAFRVGGG